MTKTRVAVIGVGYLGRFHAQKYAQLPNCELVAVVDQNEAQAQQVGSELGVPAYTHYASLLSDVDAVSVVVPTQAHYDVTQACLDQKVHVLLEKPFASTVEEAQKLTDYAQQQQCHLQIGHLERFNPVYQYVAPHIESPNFIECTRIAPFPKRGTDVDVILDLMIHDIDLVLSLIPSKPKQVEGVGVSLLTPSVDLANARVSFENGAVANFTASRISDKAERKMRIFQTGSYFSLDYGSTQVRHLKASKSADISPEDLTPEVIQLEKGDALLLEIQSFLESLEQNKAPQVTAEDGLQAMQVAYQIKDQLQHH